MTKKEKHHHKPKYSLGVDIGTHSVKAVYIKNTHKEPILLGCKTEKIETGVSEYNPNDFDFNFAVPVIRKLIASLGIKPKKLKHLVTSLGGEKVNVKQIRSAYLPEDELESSLYFEAKKHLPVGGTKLMLDYQIIKEHQKDNSLEIIISVTTEDYLKSFVDTLKNIGLNPGIIDAEALALANSYIIPNFYSYEEGGVYIMLNIGGNATNFVAFGFESSFFFRNMPFAGLHFTKKIAKDRNLDYTEAENYKLTNGIFEDEKENQNLEDNKKMTLGFKEKGLQEQLAEEVKRTIRYYVKEFGNSDFRKILLTGGSANLKGLDKYFESKLNIPVEVYNPLVLLENQSKNDNITNPQLALAFGLAIRDY